jgi:hypothetical protein
MKRQEPVYKVVLDNGKPYNLFVNGEENLKLELKQFYSNNKSEDFYFDVFVYNEYGEDISESQFITEIVSEILAEGDLEDNKIINMMKQSEVLE